MQGRGALLAVCFFLVAPSHYQILATTNRFAAPLDLSGAAVQATAECGRDANGDPVETTFCTSASTCDICNAGESERSYPARAAVDGDVATAWQSPPLSQEEEFRAVNFTLDLGQVYECILVRVHGSTPTYSTCTAIHCDLPHSAFWSLSSASCMDVARLKRWHHRLHSLEGL